MSENIGLLGAGSQADEIESYFDNDSTVGFRAVTSEYLESTNSSLINIEDPGDLKSTKVIAAVGAPGARKKMVQKWPGKEYFVLVSRDAVVGNNTSIGAGTVIAPGVVITTNVTIGEHVLINIGATISHDCKIGNFVTISPGVHIAGKVKIGDGVFIGIGSSVSNGIEIAAGSVVGAGTVVTKSMLTKNGVVIGTPGKVVKTNKGWLSAI